jgi:aminomethyltransferase
LEKETPLYREHVEAGARMVPFAGFLMPIQYSGIIDEHRSVRERMGLFDLSHMGELRVRGTQALEAVDRIVTNDISGLNAGQVRYTPMCYVDGGIVDDLLVYRLEDSLMLVVNASNIEKDLRWIREHVSEAVAVEDASDDIALIALQGPKAESFLQAFSAVDLSSIPYYHFSSGHVGGVDALVSRTGYTGEDGFELYVDPADASALWKLLKTEGEAQGLRLIGLGARDTLRLEAGYMLYGNDIDETTSPLEAGLGWTVKFGSSDFVGRAALEAQKAGGPRRRMAAIDMRDRAIPRPHCGILAGGENVGELTSGTFSPTFGRGIGLGYVRAEFAKVGTDIDVEIRNQLHPAQLVRKPMYRREVA